MTETADWENSATRPVLELLKDSRVAISPGGITLNLQLQMKRPPSRSTVTRAIEQLRERGLIEKPAETKSYYRITEEGENYISEDSDTNSID